MHTHAVLLPRIVTSFELRKFVEDEGGEWQDDALLPQGVITQGAAASKPAVAAR